MAKKKGFGLIIENFTNSLLKRALSTNSTVTNLWTNLGGDGTDKTSDYLSALEGYLYPVVMSIASDFASINFKLVEGDDDDTKELENELAMEVLYNVNKSETFYTLKEWYSLYMNLAGENFWYMPQAKVGKYREIYPINPQGIKEIKFDKKGIPVLFVYQDSEGKESKYKAEEMIYDKMPNPKNPTRGLSPVKAAALSIDTWDYAMKYNRNFFLNNAIPDTVLKIKNKMTPEGMKRLERAWNSKFKGVSKSHKTAVLEGDIDVTPLSPTFKDMSFEKILAQTKDQILANWRVPKTIIGQDENINRATAEASDYVFARRVLTPMAERFCSFLGEKYLPLFIESDKILKRKIRFEFDSPVKKEMSQAVNTASSGLSGKAFMTVNEARDIVGLDAIKEGEYDTIPEAKEPVVEEPKEDKFNIEKEVKTVTDKIKAERRIKELTDKLESMEEYKEVRDVFKDKAEKVHLELGIKNEPKMVLAMAQYFKGLKRRVFDSIPETKGVKKDISFEYDTKDEMKYIKEQVKDLVNELMEEYWDVADRVVTGTVPFKFTPDMVGYIKTSVHVFSGEIAQSTLDDLTAIFQEGVEQGFGTVKISVVLDELFDSYYKNRTKVIARTEVNNIAGRAQQLRYEEAEKQGVLEKKEWLTVGDEKVRDWHSHVKVPVVPVRSPYVVNGEKLMHPGDIKASPENRINCRCASIPFVV